MHNMYVDGACRQSNPGLCSSSFVLYKEGIEEHKQGRALLGLNTNNVAEYTALIDALEWLYAHHIRNVVIHSDSKLVVCQVNQEWRVLSDDLKPLNAKAYGLLVQGAHMLRHVPGHSLIEGNEAADKLCNEILDEQEENEKQT